MQWVIFTGTWRLTNAEVENDVRGAARHIFERGDGLVTGGATGVDYFAMHEWLKLDPGCKRIRTFIPAKLNHYVADYRKNWKHFPVNDDMIDNLEHILLTMRERNPQALNEADIDTGPISQSMYDLRHADEVANADAVYAFQVNNSTGTKDTIDKAVAAGLPVLLHKSYRIEETTKHS